MFEKTQLNSLSSLLAFTYLLIYLLIYLLLLSLTVIFILYYNKQIIKIKMIQASNEL